MQSVGRKLINPSTFAPVIIRNVYDPTKNSRKIWKFRYNSYSYGGVISTDVMGCSFRCDYCWVDNSILAGSGGIVRNHERCGESFFLSPGEVLEKLRLFIERHKLPSVQITGGEIFLTPNWSLEVLERLCEYFEQGYPYQIPKAYMPGVVWIDTQGADLMRDTNIFKQLERFREHVRLFISIKAHPRDWGQRTGVDTEFSDVGFQALEQAWRHRIIAIPQMLDGLFYPDTMPWFCERLQRIHPNAPRLLQIDKLRLYGFVPGGRNVTRMKRRGFRFGSIAKGGHRVPRNVALAAWREMLNHTYGTDSKALSPKDDFDCDKFPVRAARMVRTLIFPTLI